MNIDRDIEGSCHSCTGCQLMKQDPKLTPVHPWEYPAGPSRRVHFDFAGPVMFMVMVQSGLEDTEKIAPQRYGK